jgi:hypothetical protein
MSKYESKGTWFECVQSKTLRTWAEVGAMYLRERDAARAEARASALDAARAYGQRDKMERERDEARATWSAALGGSYNERDAVRRELGRVSEDLKRARAQVEEARAQLALERLDLRAVGAQCEPFQKQTAGR